MKTISLIDSGNMFKKKKGVGNLQKAREIKGDFNGEWNRPMGLILEVDGDYVDAYILYAMCRGLILSQARPVWLSS
jgi:hypothetical protein